jgi:hypothetical protein
MHQPMHATMIMLVDLYERPTSTEAPRSRAFIDAVFAMSGPDGGIVSGEDGVTVQRPLREGGREAWGLLRKLREKAWSKAGLDPNVLWTEEEQIRAGVAVPLTEGQRMAQALREDVLHDPVDVGSLRDSKGRVSATAGVHNLMSSAVEDMRSATAAAIDQSAHRQKHPAIANLNATDKFRATTSFPPLPSQTNIPGPASGYFTAPPPPAVGLVPAPNSPSGSITRTTTTSQGNPGTGDSLQPGIHEGTPTNGTAPPSNGFRVAVRPAHEEHHDADFWTRWDSVLGSHAGFTFEDEMEGIMWDDLGVD